MFREVKQQVERKLLFLSTLLKRLLTRIVFFLYIFFFFCSYTNKDFYIFSLILIRWSIHVNYFDMGGGALVLCCCCLHLKRMFMI